MSGDGRPAAREQGAEGLLPDLEELCRIHEIGLDLIARSHDIDDLLDRVLDEYERRLDDLPGDALDRRAAAQHPESVKKLKALVMFATQAAALREKAHAAAELRKRTELLDAVLGALASGVVVLDSKGAVVRANAAADAILGEASSGPLASRLRGEVPVGGEGEVRLVAPDGAARTVLVARRALPESPGIEVVLLMDVTQRAREVEERVRLEKLAEVMRTLSVLSHKINNPLTALLGRAQILSARKTDDPHVAKAAAVIEESSQRIAELIRELAAVVREGKHEALDHILKMPDGADREDA